MYPGAATSVSSSASPCDADGLTGKAAGPCAVRDRAGFVPATALPSKDKAGGPMPDLTRRSTSRS